MLIFNNVSGYEITYFRFSNLENCILINNINNLEEKVIKIESIDPKDFFGPQNKNIKVLKNNFPNVKIVARGSQIKAYGNSEDLSELEI